MVKDKARMNPNPVRNRSFLCSSPYKRNLSVKSLTNLVSPSVTPLFISQVSRGTRLTRPPLSVAIGDQPPRNMVPGSVSAMRLIRVYQAVYNPTDYLAARMWTGMESNHRHFMANPERSEIGQSSCPDQSETPIPPAKFLADG